MTATQIWDSASFAWMCIGILVACDWLWDEVLKFENAEVTNHTIFSFLGLVVIGPILFILNTMLLVVGEKHVLWRKKSK